MPIYEYKCAKCHGVSEALQKFSDLPLVKCLHCGGKAQRIMSLNAFHLKGNGWYTTDYAGKNSSTGKAADAAEAPSAGDKSGSTTQASAKKDKKKEAAKVPE